MQDFTGRALIAGAFAALVASAALAAGLTGADAAKDRQTHMKALGAAAKALGEQLHSGAPDKAVVQVQTAKILAAANGMPDWFPHGSGGESGVKTRTLPLIWSDSADFSAAQKRFAVAAEALNAAALSGDMAAVGAHVGPVGGACKGCHDKFREPEKS
jgi:cytochrome c556